MTGSDWVVAAYTLDGESVGWATRILSIVQRLDRAERFPDRAAAERAVPALERAWTAYQYLWVAERATPLVAQLDEQAHMRVGSSVPVATIDKRKGGVSVQKQKQPSSKSSKPTKPKPVPASKASPPTKLLPAKPVMRTTAAKLMESKPVSEGQPNGLCICGCGEQATAYLKRGHFKRLEQSMLAIARGDITPEKAFGKRLATAWAGWIASPPGAKSGKSLLEYWKGVR